MNRDLTFALEGIIASVLLVPLWVYLGGIVLLVAILRWRKISPTVTASPAPHTPSPKVPRKVDVNIRKDDEGDGAAPETKITIDARMFRRLQALLKRNKRGKAIKLIAETYHTPRKVAEQVLKTLENSIR